MKRAANFAVWFICVFSAFYFWAHQTLTSSFLLALFLAAILDSTREVAAKPTMLPHFVKFNPDVYKMLSDLSLVTSDTWKAAFDGEADTDPWSGDFVCRYGLSAYGLFVDAEGNTVVHWPRLGIYTEGFSAAIELTNFPQTDGRPGARAEWCPGLVIRRTSRGYGVGIEILTNWWESVGSKLPIFTSVHFDTDFMTGRTVVYFADFPHQPLWQFFTGPSVVESIDMKSVLEKAGWVEFDPNDPELAYFHPPTRYIHKYIEIQVNFVHHIR